MERIESFIKSFLISALLIMSSLCASVDSYFKNFEILAKSENWTELVAQGTAALEEAKKEGRIQDEAKICAQLTSTNFYQGNYDKALVYATRCHELAENFEDSSLFVRALYLESAVYRALADYGKAVQIAEEAAQTYAKKKIQSENLRGKVYFNLGAAHADNPIGNLEAAAKSYSIALQSFKMENATDDLIRTSLRLGKVYLLQKNFDAAQKTLDEARPQITNERIAMHADYLEAQLKLELGDLENAKKIAKTGLARAEALGAKEDKLRLTALLERIKK